MTPSPQALPRLLTELRSLAPPEDGQVIDELERRLDEHVLRVLVAGEAKRGKSTLVNALLGRDVLPTGVVPVTAVATTVRSGSPEQVLARFADGTTRPFPLTALADLVTERGNPRNERRVTDVEVHLALPLLDGLELVDTPGVGSVHAHNTAEAETALRRMDVAVFVLTVDPPVSASERTFLREVRDQSVRLLCVLNKVDRLGREERDEAVAFTRAVLAEELGADVPLFPLSAGAERADPGGDKGFREFSEEFAFYVRTAGPVDLRRSVAARAGRLARSVADAQQALLAALAVSEGDLADRLSRFRAAQSTVERDRAEALAVAEAEFRHLQAETDSQGAELERGMRPSLLRDVAERVGTVKGSAAAIEDAAQQFTADRIRAAVDTWRSRRARELEDALRSLDERATARVQDQIRAVRDAAAALFPMTLPPLPVPARLAASGRFSYAFDPDPGQIELLTTAIRTRLPEPLARRRIATHAVDRAEMLLNKHTGRCSAAFRQQLADTRRGFLRELDRRFEEGAGRIAAAIATAGEMRATQRAEVDAARTRAEAALRDARSLADRCAQMSSEETPRGEGTSGGSAVE